MPCCVSFLAVLRSVSYRFVPFQCQNKDFKLALVYNVCPPLCCDSPYMKRQWTGHTWRDHRPVKLAPQTRDRPIDCIRPCRISTGEAHHMILVLPITY